MTMIESPKAKVLRIRFSEQIVVVKKCWGGKKNISLVVDWCWHNMIFWSKSQRLSGRMFFFSQRNCSFHLHLVFAEVWHWLLPISIAGTDATNCLNFHLSDFHHWNNCRPLPESPLLSDLSCRTFLRFPLPSIPHCRRIFIWICVNLHSRYQITWTISFLVFQLHC